jgi:hypothetical protein
MERGPLPDLIDTTSTRQTLHHLAEHVMATEQFAANHELALGVSPGGFATGWFPGPDGHPRRIRIEGAALIRETERSAERETIAPPFDEAAAGVLYAWWALGAAVLTTVEPRAGESVSTEILWPEHFDIAVTVTGPDDHGLNLGFSPGDEFSAQPYAYAGPWQPLTGEFWNAPFGAYRTYEQLAAADDPHAAAAAFLAAARAQYEQATG